MQGKGSAGTAMAAGDKRAEDAGTAQSKGKKRGENGKKREKRTRTEKKGGLSAAMVIGYNGWSMLGRGALLAEKREWKGKKWSYKEVQEKISI